MYCRSCIDELTLSGGLGLWGTPVHKAPRNIAGQQASLFVVLPCINS